MFESNQGTRVSDDDLDTNIDLQLRADEAFDSKEGQTVEFEHADKENPTLTRRLRPGEGHGHFAHDLEKASVAGKKGGELSRAYWPGRGRTPSSIHE
ncbi:uncharacterized protein DSM5745_01025 [Aspergillus mulundensis]|uniref:Uncharacterized protein n=1 Tax=Aspergillus mulundensis TaxID=1810919 RepID=A0A3D8T574_9EURO|nr:hypothetical protein DSM5745_01025 [Aspergillus mulundensis]RDW93703.1 hypothetical protein DSM5745_01025 [Aspergillus mulundensis]